MNGGHRTGGHRRRYGAWGLSAVHVRGPTGFELAVAGRRRLGRVVTRRGWLWELPIAEGTPSECDYSHDESSDLIRAEPVVMPNDILE